MRKLVLVRVGTLAFRYGVFVAFALSAVAYVALARLQSREPATAAEG